MSMYELIDRFNHDSHDEGTLDEMLAAAEVLNAAQAAHGPVDDWPWPDPRWIVRPEGWSQEHYSGI